MALSKYFTHSILKSWEICVNTADSDPSAKSDLLLTLLFGIALGPCNDWSDEGMIMESMNEKG